MRNIRIDTIDQRLISGESKRPIKSGVVYKKYPKIPFAWSDPRVDEKKIWFNKTTRVLKVEPRAGRVYSFLPDTIATTTTSTSSTVSTSSSSSSTISSTSSSSSTVSTTTTTV